LQVLVAPSPSHTFSPGWQNRATQASTLQVSPGSQGTGSKPEAVVGAHELLLVLAAAELAGGAQTGDAAARAGLDDAGAGARTGVVPVPVVPVPVVAVGSLVPVVSAVVFSLSEPLPPTVLPLALPSVGALAVPVTLLSVVSVTVAGVAPTVSVVSLARPPSSPQAAATNRTGNRGNRELRMPHVRRSGRGLQARSGGNNCAPP
jgi:hypothetical protein